MDQVVALGEAALGEGWLEAELGGGSAGGCADRARGAWTIMVLLEEPKAIFSLLKARRTRRRSSRMTPSRWLTRTRTLMG